MKLSNIAKIKDLNTEGANKSSIQKLTNKVNEHLNNGWTLLETYKVDYGHPDKNIENIHYVLGIDKDTLKYLNQSKSSQD